MLATVLGVLACVSFALYFWQFLLGIRFRINSAASLTTFPAVTILKPLKGCDSGTEACLRTWLDQDYPGPTQILFGVASEDDPAVNVVRNRLKANVVVCPEKLGPNAKVSTLAQLEPLIQHDLVIISDADVAVSKNFLKSVVAFFETESPSLASCLYRISGAANFSMRLEAFIVNSDFWSQVLQSIALKPMKFALGAAMIVRRSALIEIGGFRSIVDYLADDFQLGNRIGGEIALCPTVVECRASPMTWREVWKHQIRWARTIRVCQPAPFFFSILSNPTIWLLAWAATGAWPVALTIIGLRSIGGAVLETKLTQKFYASSIFLALLADILRAVFWFLAFAGNRIFWAGKCFRVSQGGKLTPV